MEATHSLAMYRSSGLRETAAKELNAASVEAAADDMIGVEKQISASPFSSRVQYLSVWLPIGHHLFSDRALLKRQCGEGTRPPFDRLLWPMDTQSGSLTKFSVEKFTSKVSQKFVKRK